MMVSVRIYTYSILFVGWAISYFFKDIGRMQALVVKAKIFTTILCPMILAIGLLTSSGIGIGIPTR